jgi:PilZ domain
MTELMKKSDERRSIHRIEVPGVSLKFKLSRGVNVLKNYSTAPDILNVSKSGIAFKASQNAGYGDVIQLKLSFPDGKNINLKGKVRWSRETNGDSGKSIGVLFDPFGLKRQYNSIKALEYLRSLKDQAISQVFNPDMDEA